jgi:hypothetical protein
MKRLTDLTWFLFVVVAASSLLLGLLIFQDFVFGDKILLYKDIGSDSLNVFYPNYILRSDYLRQHGMLSWSFETGMGQNLFPFLGTLLLTPIVWLSKETIARALIYQHLLYVVICAVCFARFLTLRGLNLASSLLGALLLSFSAYMCMGSCWFFHAAELVCFSVLLVATEMAVGPKRWPFLALAIVLMSFLGAFHLYLAALFLCFYLSVRLLEERSSTPRSILQTSSLLAGVAFLGLALSAVVSVSGFFTILNSPRGSGPTSLTHRLSSFSFFSLETPLHYVTAILRPLGNDLLGTGSSFHGWMNYLEAPMTYCGLISILLLPQAFVDVSRRRRIVYSLIVLFLILPTVFPWFRHLFWAFQGNYYRAYSLFSIMAALTLAMTAFSRFAETRALNVWVLGATTVLLVGILFLPANALQSVIDRSLRPWAISFLLTYAGLLTLGYFLHRQRLVSWIVVIVAAGELYHFDRITVLDSRPVVTRKELTERIGYNDETVDVIRDLKLSDRSFYRVTKTFLSGPGMYGSVNDAMVFGFFGTSSYSSFNNLNYTNFLLAVDVIDRGIITTDTQWSLGLLGHPLLSTFAAEKYVLTDDPVPYQTAEGYEFMRHYGSRYLFKNQFFLPLGLAFDRYMGVAEFLQLSTDAKASALLHAVVLPDDASHQREGLTPLNLVEMKNQIRGTTIAEIVKKRRQSALELREFSENRMKGTIRLQQKSILVVQTPFDPGWCAWQDGRARPVTKVDFGLVGVPLDSGNHEVELHYVPAFSLAGGAITFVALIVFMFAAYRWPRSDTRF